MNARIGGTGTLGSCSYPGNLTEKGIVMCKFCENKKRIEFDDGKETWNIQNTEKGYEMIYANHETGRLKSITISNCPICGRKLTDREENEVKTDKYIEELLDEVKKLNDRHQSDCITINQLNATIDVLVDKLARLR